MNMCTLWCIVSRVQLKRVSAVVTTVVSSGFSGPHGREAHSHVPRGTGHTSYTVILVFLLGKFILKVHI